MVKGPLKGTLGEVTYLNGKQLAYPNNEIDIDAFNKARQQNITGHTSHFTFLETENDEFTSCLKKCKY